MARRRSTPGPACEGRNGGWRGAEEPSRSEVGRLNRRSGPGLKVALSRASRRPWRSGSEASAQGPARELQRCMHSERHKMRAWCDRPSPSTMPLPHCPPCMHGRRASEDEPERQESATATMTQGRMHATDDAGPRLRVALAAVDEVGGPLGAVRAIWFGSAGARTRPMPADQTRSFHKKGTWGRAAPTRDRPTPSAGPHKILPNQQWSPPRSSALPRRAAGADEPVRRESAAATMAWRTVHMSDANFSLFSISILNPKST